MNYNLKQAQRVGVAGTTLFVVIMLLILLFVKLKHDIIDPPVNQVEVEMDMGDLGGTFGDGAEGSPAPEVTNPPVEPITAPTPKPAPAEPVMTQEDPSVVAARAEKKKAEEKRKQELAAEKAAKAAEQVRIAAEQKAAAEKKAKEDQAKALAAGAFGKGGTSSGSGPGGGGSGSTPGNPLGKGSGTSNGQSWSLSGRDLVGSIPKPAYVGNQEGVIIITITVDKSGNVIGTDVGKGTTISDEALRNECKASARKIKFTTNPKAVGNQIGSITYRFKEK
ncbi:MAG: hypothetical protein J6P49_00870 [Paludibacteraceae bacterium]|nr:hypothetical protein [Paludibacteraceae bacterium]